MEKLGDTPEEKPSTLEVEESKSKTETVTTKRQKVTDNEEVATKEAPADTKEEEKDGKQLIQDGKRGRKRKLAMVVGYNGANFLGSQKNHDIRSVELVLETALFEAGMIDHRNYGDLKKIGFSRATRTDKRVHALQNYFCAKLIVDENKTLEQYVDTVNEKLPEDVRIFSFMHAMGGFEAKIAVSYREYDYYLPTFMLSKETKVSYIVPEGDQPSQHMDPDNPRSIKRVKIDIDKSNLEDIYQYRIPDAQKEVLERLLSNFEGTHKYHNYTKNMKAKDKNSQRYMIEVKVLDYREYDGIEFARVYLKGQSFLYNQIRKMMGAIFMVMHFGLPEQFIENSLKDNETNVPTAPGEGLMLNKVSYERYNREKLDLKVPIKPWDSKLDEIEEYRVNLVKYICSTEKNTHAFTQWMAWMDEAKDNFI